MITKKGQAIVLSMVLVGPAYLCAEPQSDNAATSEPTLYEHYVSMKKMQESLASRSLEDQVRLQPVIQRAERRACEQLTRDRHNGMTKADYRRQGGDEFLVFAHQFEQYCNTIY